MTTSPTSFLVEPEGDNPVGPRALGYVSEATRDAIYDFIIQRLLESGISRATLARRLDKDASQLSRTLGAPGNWTIDTCAELLFAIDGSTLKFGQSWPLREKRSNRTGSVCVNFEPEAIHPTTGLSSVKVLQYKPVFAQGSSPRALEYAN